MNVSRPEIDFIITEHMLDLGIPAHLKGYQYMREAIVMTIEDVTIATSPTKLLYPDVARRFGTTDQKVERAIRNAIETSWIRGNNISEKSIFGYTRDDGVRPTNSEYISKFAEFIRLEILSREA